jgi:hypothetical protein
MSNDQKNYDERAQTEGEWLVGLDFNPSGNEDVNTIKAQTADLIDYVSAHGKDPRCTALAKTAFEEAAMWAVKSVTKQPRRP